jgi:hypothetical protein
MKEIEYNGEIFQYQVLSDTSEWGESTWTEFYQGTYTEETRRFFFFGPKIQVTKPILKFYVNINIESPSYTKEMVREKIEREYFNTVGREAREKEIKRGEII